MHAQRVCFTLHNFHHQGQVGPELLWATAKAGIVYANFVTTVSERHRTEALTTDQNFGLGDALWTHRDKFGGVLNGVDYEVWNPEIDPLIQRCYGFDSLDHKHDNKLE
jgi:starch synthase